MGHPAPRVESFRTLHLHVAKHFTVYSSRVSCSSSGLLTCPSASTGGIATSDAHRVSAMWISGPNPLLPHPRPQRIRHHERAISLLIVFQNGQDRACHRDGCAVERVDKARPFLPGHLVANTEAARLIIRAVGGA